MKFSVVIPLYNKEKNIKRAIYSILNQTYMNYEIIVVNDGSNDLSVEKVNEINDPRIKIISQKNSGVSAARNTGIAHSNFDLIAFLDADDAWEPDFLEKIVHLNKKYPQAGAYATSYVIKKKDGTILRNKTNTLFTENWDGLIDFFKESLITPLISASSVVIQKKVISTVGGFPIGINRGEDLDMWCRIALNYPVAYSHKICASYFQDAENRACNLEIDFSKTFMSYAEELLQTEKEKGNNSRYFEEYMISRLIAKAKYMISINKRREARSLLWEYKYTELNKRKLIKTFIQSFALYDNLKNKK